MRGKKSNPEFVSQYLRDCLSRGISNSDEMVQEAKKEIQDIDNQIKQIQELKTRRSKLLDVINTFEKKISNDQQGKVLSLFNLSYPQTCKKICDAVNQVYPNYGYSINNIKDPEILFCIKQLIECSVLSRSGNAIICGERFNEYMKNVFHQE